MIDYLWMLQDQLRSAQERDIDLSRQYDPFDDAEESKFVVQEDIMLATRAVKSRYALIYLLDTPIVLATLKGAKDRFGNHPYHHILEGRIASVVQRGVKFGAEIPPEYIDDFLFFDFKPWNSPGLNYSTLDQLREKSPECVPPEFRV